MRVVRRMVALNAKTDITWTKEDATHVVMQYLVVSNAGHLINVCNAQVNFLRLMKVFVSAEKVEKTSILINSLVRVNAKQTTT